MDFDGPRAVNADQKCSIEGSVCERETEFDHRVREDAARNYDGNMKLETTTTRKKRRSETKTKILYIYIYRRRKIQEKGNNTEARKSNLPTPSPAHPRRRKITLNIENKRKGRMKLEKIVRRNGRKKGSARRIFLLPPTHLPSAFLVPHARCICTGDSHVRGLRPALWAYTEDRHALRRASCRGRVREDIGKDPRRQHTVTD